MNKPIDYRKAQLLSLMVNDLGDSPLGYTHLELSRALGLKKSPWTMTILDELMRDGYVKCHPYGLQLRNGLLVHVYYVPIEQREAAKEYADNVFDYHSLPF